MFTPTYSVPVPTRGWNERDPITQMDPQDAIRLVNIFPNTATCDIRKGSRVHATGLGSGAVQGLFEFSGPTGTRKLIGTANNKIYDCTTYNAAATDITNGATITVNKWQAVNFRAKLILVNGTDQPLQMNASTTVTSATYTGVSNDNLLAHVSVYKSRLYFCETNTASIWYGAANEVTGALTEDDYSGRLQRGGYLLFSGAYSRDLGDSTDDLFVVVSNMGEVLAYSGDYPGAKNWVQVTRYFIPVPIGRRGFVRMGSDMTIITEDGVYPLSEVLASGRQSKKLTDRIQNAFRRYAALYKGNFGWQAIEYPRSAYLVINVPVSESTNAEQFVMNTQTGAWCKFTGLKAVSWSLLNEKLYFGGTNGKVYEADYGANDAGANIDVDLKGAFNYLGSKTSAKRVSLARPLITSDYAVSFVFNLDTDFGNKTITDTVSIMGSAGAEWDSATWDVDSWDGENVYSDDWYSVSGVGRCVAPRLSGSFNNVQFSLSGIDYIYEQGGPL
jgi:hypothetical protein